MGSHEDSTRLMPVLELPFFISALDLFGTVAFAVAGVLSAARKDLDLFGIIVAGTVTAIGGGTLRDLVLGRVPVFWVVDPTYLWLTFSSTILTFFLARKYNIPHSLVLIADAVGLAVFTVIGAEISLLFGHPPIICIVTGVITAVFGGAVRDVFIAQIPLLFRRELYATPAFLGAIIFTSMRLHFPEQPVVTYGFSMAVVFFIRLYSIYKGIHLPRFLIIDQNKKI